MRPWKCGLHSEHASGDQHESPLHRRHKRKFVNLQPALKYRSQPEFGDCDVVSPRQPSNG